MKFRLPLFFLICAFFSLQNISASCLEVTIPRTEFFIGETFQAEIAMANPLEYISRENINFFIKDGSVERNVEFPFKVVRVSNDISYIYFTIPNVKEGEYKLRVRGICKEGSSIIGAESIKKFNIGKEKIGGAYKKLSDEIVFSWGNTEENALALLALNKFDSRFFDYGKNALLQKAKNGECWPSPTCRVKDTSLALLALKDSEEISKLKAKNWLLDAQNSLARGEWNLILSSSQNGFCELDLNGKNETLAINKVATKTLSFADDATYKLTVKCNVSLSGAKVSHSFFGKVIEFPLQQKGGIWEISASNEKCWGATYRGNCDFESTAFAYFVLRELDEAPEGVLEWLKQNKNDTSTLDQVFLNIFTGENYYTEWLIINQALDGYWKDKSLSAGGTASPFITALAIYSLKDSTENKSISAMSRGKEWLLKRSDTLSKRDLAASLYFVFSAKDIKDVVSTSPGIVKVMYNQSFEILVENKGIRDINVTLNYLGQMKGEKIPRDSSKRFIFNAASETNDILTLTYSGFYNIPVFVIKIVQGEEVIKNVTIPVPENITSENVSIIIPVILPSIEFKGSGEKTLFNNQTRTITLKLVNSNPQQIEDVFLLLTSELYGIVKVEPAKVDLAPNSEAEIMLIINENKNAVAGVYEGEVKAKDSVSASFPIRIEVLSSGQERKQTCFDLFFQCCEKAKEGALTKPELDYTCPRGLICADICKEAEEGKVETKKLEISPIIWILIATMLGIIFLIFFLKSKAGKKRKKRGMEEIVEKIEEKWERK